MVSRALQQAQWVIQWTASVTVHIWLVLSDFQMTVRGACQTSEKRDRKRSEERTGLNSTGEKQKFITSIINHKYMILFGDVT